MGVTVYTLRNGAVPFAAKKENEMKRLLRRPHLEWSEDDRSREYQMLQDFVAKAVKPAFKGSSIVKMSPIFGDFVINQIYYFAWNLLPSRFFPDRLCNRSYSEYRSHPLFADADWATLEKADAIVQYEPAWDTLVEKAGKYQPKPEIPRREKRDKSYLWKLDTLQVSLSKTSLQKQFI